MVIAGGFSHAAAGELQSDNPQEFGMFGAAVDGVPDINGDGRGDVVVGAPQEDPQNRRVPSNSAFCEIEVKSHS